MVKCLLPVLSGFLLAASFPRISLSLSAWIALIPLLVYIHQVETRRAAFCGGFLAGSVQIFILMRWIPGVLSHFGGLSSIAGWIAYFFLVCLLACYHAMTCVITKHGMKRCGGWFLLCFPLIGVLQEYAQTYTPFGGLPWLCMGYAQISRLSLLQIADITGIYGVSFLVLGMNAALAWLLLCRRRWSRRAVAPTIAVGLLVCACWIYGYKQQNVWQKSRPQFQAAMLQGNISLDDSDEVQADKFRDGYVRMADRLEPDRPDLLLLPESPSPVFYQIGFFYRRTMEQLAGRYPLGLVLSNVNFKESGGELSYFNSAFFLDRNGALVDIYDKMHLVPFGEYIPLKKLFFFAETVSRDVGGFSPGTKAYRPVRLGAHSASAIICFEAIFPGLVRRFVQRGSGLIINLANDGWYGISDAPYQHLAITRLRAIENRRYVLRATNSGISAIIEPTGRIQASTELMKADICRGRFDFIQEKTFYTRYGDVFVFLCAIILICCILKVEICHYKLNGTAG